MNHRERRLAAVVVGTIALWLGNQGLQNYRAAVDENLAIQRDAVEALAATELQLALGRRARSDMNQWRAASLPTNRDLARSLYQDWLRTKLQEAGLAIKTLTDNSGIAVEGDIRELTFAVRAEGSLESLVKFLYQFYRASHLHRISAASIAVGEEGKQLDIQLTIDGLVLAGAPRSDQLPETVPPADPSELDTVVAAIVPRDLFSPYKPPAPAEEIVAEAADPVDEAAQATRVSGASYGEGGWLVWLTEKDKSRPTYYGQGDRLEVGQFSGRIVEIDRRRIVVEKQDGKVEIRLGQTLAEATAVEEPEDAETTTVRAVPQRREAARSTADEAPTPIDAGGLRYDGS